MDPELLFATLIILVLLLLASYFAWRSRLVFQGLRHLELPPEDRRYHLALAWRRLVGCALMVVLAGLLAWSYWVGQERQARELAARKAPVVQEGAQPEPSAEQKEFLNQYSTFWIIFSLIFLGWISLAFFDFWAIRRFGLRQYRQIQADRRAMIEHQLARLRSQRNGKE